MEDKASLLLKQGVKAVITTLGADGVLLCAAKQKTHYPAARFISIDSSGAEDAFISAFISYLINGYNIEHAVQIANYATCLSTTRQGVISLL